MTDDRHRAAAHEAGHAVAAWLLGRHVVMVSLDGWTAPTGGPCSVDRAPTEPLQGSRRPLPHWHALEDEVLIVMAGALCEDLAEEYAAPPVPVPSGPRRVADPAPLRAVSTPVMWQDADEPPTWPGQPLSDADQVAQLVSVITTTDVELEVLTRALRLRCESMVRHPHFAALHRHLWEALLRDGEMYGPQVRCELERADLRYTTTTMTTTEDDDDSPQAA